MSQFPAKSKFVPFRVVTLNNDHNLNAIHDREGCWKWDPRVLLHKEAQAIEECKLVFLDSRNPYAQETAERLKSISKTPVAYVSCAEFGTMTMRIDFICAKMRLEELRERGWEAVELSFGPSAAAGFVHSVITEAKRLGFSICVYVDKTMEKSKWPLATWGVDALSGSEMRSSKSMAAFKEFLGKGRPMYLLEYGTPTSPGKSKLDMKTFALRHSVSVTLANFGLKLQNSPPIFYFFVTN